MNSSRIFIALALLVGLGVAVASTRSSREAKTSLEAPSATLKAPKKEEISEFAVTRANQPTIVLKKQGDKWRMSAPIDAEASASSVEAALDRMSDLVVTGVAASRKENHERLEVDAAHGIHVVAKGADKPLLDIYVGASKSGGTMVRKEGDEQVLTVRGSFRYVFDKEPKDFRKREVTEFESAELTSFTVSSDKGTFKLVKNGEAWAQAPGEKPIAKFDGAQAQSIASTATNLRAQDFAAPGESAETTGLNNPKGKVLLTKKDGSTIEISIGNATANGDEYYVKTSQSDVVYRLAKFSTDRLMPDAKYFEQRPPPPPPPPEPTMPPPGAMPPGMMNNPHGGAGGITPEMMQQLQRELQKAQQEQK